MLKQRALFRTHGDEPKMEDIISANQIYQDQRTGGARDAILIALRHQSSGEISSK